MVAACASPCSCSLKPWCLTLQDRWLAKLQAGTQPAKGDRRCTTRPVRPIARVLQLLRAMPRSQAYYSALAVAPLRGAGRAGGLLALQQAASTGALFADAGGSTVGNALRWGPARPLQWCWHRAARPARALVGRARLGSCALLLPVTAASLCHNSPPLFIDAERANAGR